ncbi:hypothetical protein KCTC52924_02025 [Arenibacter antarcticus]|uniref:hypothetical protein n=1 Tax=Arenibacter antarcticus TaxID=2040469 RepID=UPI00351DFF48
MSQFTYFILELNLLFAGVIILIILYGMFFTKRNNQLDTGSNYHLPHKKTNEDPSNQY